MSNVLLFFPSFTGYEFGERWRGSESLTPPLGLLYLATALRKHGHALTLVDLSIERWERAAFAELVRAQDFILISCYTQSIQYLGAAMQDLRELNPRAQILCGGPYCRETQKYIQGSDVTAIGEADCTIVPMLEALSSGASLSHIPDIIYRDEEQIVRTPADPNPQTFLEGQYPLLELARDKNYGWFGGVRIPNVAPILTSRGCPFQCTFCTWNFVTYRKRSIPDVMAEIEERARQGYKYLIFCDDNFLLSKERVIPLASHLVGRTDNRVGDRNLVLARELSQLLRPARISPVHEPHLCEPEAERGRPLQALFKRSALEHHLKA